MDTEAVTQTICKEGTIWRMGGEMANSFSWKDLLDKVRPWYAFIFDSLLPMTHLRDVTSEQAILLYAIKIGHL